MTETPGNTHMSPQAPRAFTRRRVVASAGGAAGAVLLAACSTGGQPAASTKTAELNGTFNFSVQNFQPTINIIDRAIPTFQAKHPSVKISYTPVAFGDMAAKTAAEVAGGSGHDGFHTYTGFWRGKDASSVMMPLTPTLFKKPELEQLFFANTLKDAVWSRKQEVFIMPFACGVNGSMLLWNDELAKGSGVDPRTFTSLDQVIAGATRLVRREGSNVSVAGLLPNSHTNLLMRWILDQGGKFYDEGTSKWTWQTTEAERALQWLQDVYDKHNVAWKTAPADVRDALGEQRAAMVIQGAFAISGYVTSHPDTYKKLVDQPMPAFSAGKTPSYYEHEYSGYALSALLKPDDMKARIGSEFYKTMLSSDGLIQRANEYSGAILAKGVYSDPRFKDTTFGPIRAKLPDQVISKLRFMTMAVRPEEGQDFINKVINGQASVKAALGEMQQHFQNKEDDARRNMK
jgi:ABC-type glycerol-3-phosphate transport system substrate-binding protein